MIAISATIAGILFAGEAFAASGGFINYYHMILHSFGIQDPHLIEAWSPVLGGLLTTGVITCAGVAYRRRVESNPQVVPDNRFSVVNIVDVILEFIYDLGQDVIGKAHKRFFPLLAGLFIFILISNISGLVPGFTPATESINTNLAMALVVFLSYNLSGIKEHGASYVKQFLGPTLFLMPLMLIIETVAHLARPVSLSLRLYGNIFGDHLVLSVFTNLAYVLASGLLFFGLLVACLQSFVFTLLSSIYISMAISHDH